MGRTRKTIVALSAGLVGVLIMAGVAAASRGSAPPANVFRASGRVVHAARHHDDVTPSSMDTTTIAPDVSSTSEPEHAQPEPGDDNGNDAADEETTTTVAGNPTTTTVDETSTSVPDETSTSVPDEPSTTVAPVANGQRTFTVAGGTVVVDVEGQTLSLVSVTPNAGVEIKDQQVEPDRIEVDFRGPSGDSRVRVRFEDGQLRAETGDD